MIDEIIETLIFEFNINSVSEVSRSQIKSNALIFKYKDKYEIYIDKELPLSVKKFAILHEIGHVALGFVVDGPQINYSQQIETKINLWAFEHYKVCIPERNEREKIKKALQYSEERGFQLITQIRSLL